MRTGEVDRWGGCLRAPLNAPRVWVLRSQDSGTGAPRDSSPGPWGSLNNGVQAAQRRSPELPQRPPRNQVANVTLDAGRSGPFPDRSEPAPFPRHLSYFLPPARFPPAPAPPPRRGRGDPAPPQGKLGDPPQQLSEHVEGLVTPKLKAK